MTDSSIIGVDVPRPPSFRLTGRLLVGIGLLAAGVFWTLDNLGVASASDVLAWWPVLAIAYGFAKLIGITPRRGVFVASLWILGGAWMLLHNLGYLRPGIEALWPLLLVALGLRILTGHTRFVYRVRGHTKIEGEESDAVKCDVVMASVQRRIHSATFRRAELNTVMGNIQADLRDATMAEGTAVIEANCVMGAIEIFVPVGWRVENEATSALGRVEDRTRPVPSGASAPTLVVRGAAVMGSIEIQH